MSWRSISSTPQGRRSYLGSIAIRLLHGLFRRRHLQDKTCTRVSFFGVGQRYLRSMSVVVRATPGCPYVPCTNASTPRISSHGTAKAHARPQGACHCSCWSSSRQCSFSPRPFSNPTCLSVKVASRRCAALSLCVSRSAISIFTSCSECRRQSTGWAVGAGALTPPPRQVPKPNPASVQLSQATKKLVLVRKWLAHLLVVSPRISPRADRSSLAPAFYVWRSLELLELLGTSALFPPSC